ncbi:multiple epidermal growth factor-like domains 10 [Elysia marginata]|uniref:Multiple epidermal growth factor-like domains 10 n=1 Tax=Elysia marginata TaxID=1093978 RepID=A0AAV4FRV1_9GAST|nr:multiple epidermal growth factor-like domains 10 [Elysia marginata]
MDEMSYSEFSPNLATLIFLSHVMSSSTRVMFCSLIDVLDDKTLARQLFLFSYFQTIIGQTPKGKTSWIGLNISPEGNYRWLDSNEEMKFISQFGIAHEVQTGCGVLGYYGSWIIKKCQTLLPYFCQAETSAAQTVKTTECAHGTYGKNCAKNCSNHCYGNHKKCHHETGRCSSGCAAGYEGSKCDSECRSGTYGQNCSQSCSRHCGGPRQECHHITGGCISGCAAGYEDVKCTSRKNTKM